nr:MAG TPA: hypothetical protein [Caudoviricetes sp.]
MICWIGDLARKKMAVWLMAAPRDSAPPLTRGFGFFLQAIGSRL